MFRLVVDDGTATVPVVIWREASSQTLNGLDPITTLALGSYVSVRGRLERKDGLVEISATRVARSISPNAEPLWWTDVVRVHERVYCKPCPPVTIRHGV
jgi:hypothetical protein